MFLHAVVLAFFLSIALAGLAAIVGPYRAAMAALRADMAGNEKRAASLEARPLPMIEPGPVVTPALSAPLGQPIRLRRQRRLRRVSLMQPVSGLTWLQRQGLRFGPRPAPAFAAAGGHSFSR